MHVYQDFHEAYTSTLQKLIDEPDFKAKPRGHKTHEILNYFFKVQNPQTGIIWEQTGLPERGKVVAEYTKREMDWYESGETHESKGFPAKFWYSIKDKDGHVTSNYGKMVFKDKKYEGAKKTKLSGFEYVTSTLKNDPDSRQAVIHYGEPKYFWQGNKDTPCCATNQFFVRGGLLLMTVYMRSNDAIKGLTYDYPWYCHVQKKVADELGLLPGPVTYLAGSMHLYEEDFKTAQAISQNVQKQSSFDAFSH